MEESKIYKLGEVCTKIGSGATPKGGKEAYLGGDTSLIRSQNVLEFSFSWDGLAYINDEQASRLNGVELERNDVLLNITGDSVARACIVPDEALPARVNQHVAIIRGDQSIVLNDYILYYLQFKKQYLLSLSQGGATRNALTKGMIEELEIPLPALNKQKGIVSILKSLDDKIELNRRINDNLEQQAQALFKSWFVDFEPFKDQPFVESELGMIPQGWRVYSMDELVEVIGGYSYKGSELQDSNIAMATIKNFNRNGGFKIDGFKEIIPSPKAKPDQYLAKYDILIAHTDLTQNADIIGNPALLLNFGDYERIIMSMDLVKVNSKVESITYGLLYSFFADSRFKSHALGYVNGTTVLHLSKKSIPEYKIALPCDLTIVNQYGLILNSLFEKESFIIDESRRLAELRDTLLPRLMSGELKVNDVDA